MRKSRVATLTKISKLTTQIIRNYVSKVIGIWSSPSSPIFSVTRVFNILSLEHKCRYFVDDILSEFSLDDFISCIWNCTGFLNSNGQGANMGRMIFCRRTYVKWYGALVVYTNIMETIHKAKGKWNPMHWFYDRNRTVLHYDSTMGCQRPLKFGIRPKDLNYGTALWSLKSIFYVEKNAWISIDQRKASGKNETQKWFEKFFTSQFNFQITHFP